MPVKVVIKGQKEKEAAGKGKVPAIRPPEQKGKSYRDNVIYRTIKIMVMDVRMRLSPKVREDYERFSHFHDLARGDRK